MNIVFFRELSIECFFYLVLTNHKSYKPTPCCSWIIRVPSEIRGNAKGTTAVYRELTNDIRNLNRELKRQIDLETGIPGKAGGLLALTGTRQRRLYPEKQSADQTLKYLLGTQYFGGKNAERSLGTIDEFARRLEKLQGGLRERTWEDLGPRAKATFCLLYTSPSPRDS